MGHQSSKDLFRRLSTAAGPPGAEDEVRGIVRETLEGVGKFEYDRLGSLLCEKRGGTDTPRIVLDAHLDEVGFMVQNISAEGRLSLVALGGWWGHVLLGQRVDILTETGRVHGVIGSTPPHFLAPEQRNSVMKLEDMYVDVGASERSHAEALGIRLGDPVVPHAVFREMGVPGIVSGKAFDNRIGVCLMCETLLNLRDVTHPNTVIGVGAAQEEVGLRGAGTAAEVARPDVALILECTPADDLPGRSDRQALLGAGPQIRLFDPTAIPNRRLVRLVEQVATEIDVPIQLAVRRTGGTDAGAVHQSGRGVPSVVIGIPGRYIHSHVSLLQWADYLAARKLVVELVRRLDAATVEGLTRFA